MNYAHHRFSLDVHESSAQVLLACKKGETARKLLISLSEGGLPYTLADDCYAVFTATKADGTVLFNDCIIENDIITYEFTPQTTSMAGKIDCELRVYSLENGLLVSPRFIIVVYNTALDDSLVESSSEFSMLTKIISEVNKLLADIEEKLANGEFNGADGKSAYEIALLYGFEGTEEEWLESLAYKLNDEDVKMIVNAVLDALPVAEEVQF